MKKIMGAFAPDSPLMEALGKLADLAFCTVLFLLCSLPILTMGAAWAALYDCTLSIAQDTEDTFIPRQFWGAFRANLKRSIPVWLICLGAVALLALYRAVIGTIGGLMGRSYQVLFFVLVMLFICGFQYLFPLMARYPMKTKELLKNAWLLSAAALPYTLGTLVITGGMVYLTLFMNPDAFNIMVYLWAFVLPAIVAYLNSFLFLKAFEKIEIKPIS